MYAAWSIYVGESRLVGQWLWDSGEKLDTRTK